MAECIADEPLPERDALARRVADSDRGETQPPVSSIRGAERDGVRALRHAPCGFRRGTARRIEKKRDRVADHQSDCALALWRLGQLVDEEAICFLALHRFFRYANDAGDIVLRRLQLDRRGLATTSSVGSMRSRPAPESSGKPRIWVAIGFAPLLRSVTVAAESGATTSKRTGAIRRDAAEAPLAANQAGSNRTPKARDIFRVGAIVSWTLNVPVAVAASPSLQAGRKERR